jgi:hypothetical protein
MTGEHKQGTKNNSVGRWVRFIERLMKPKDWVATLVALCALAISVWSGVEGRTFNRLTSRPHFVIGEALATSSPMLGEIVANLGPGIGIIDDFQISLDGKHFAGDEADQWHAFQTTTGIADWTNSGGYRKGNAVAATTSGISEILLIVDETKFSQKYPQEWKAQSDRIKTVLERLTVDIKYHSVYNEYFEIERKGLETPKYRKRSWTGSYNDWEP